MNDPLVSVIVTSYNIKTSYVDECIDSLLNQTYDNIEIVCMDDCSQLVDYAYLQSKSDKIKYYKNPTNLGMNKNVSKGFRLASGEYIVRLDGDDYFDTTLIEKETNFLENNLDYGAVCCEIKRFGKNQQHITRLKEWDYRDILENKRFSEAGYAGGVMFRKSLLDCCSIDESLRMCEDLDFHLQILNYMKIGSLHEILYYYRSHGNNLCSSVRRTERLAILDRIVKKHRKNLK